MDKLPENYSFYDQYVVDIKEKKLVKVKVLFWIPFLTPSTPLAIKTKDFELKFEVSENKIKVMFDRLIPVSLYEDLKKIDKSSLSFLIGYVTQVIPFINEHILKNKYQSAQLINRPINTFDIRDLLVVNLQNGERLLIPWPVGISNFPFKEVLLPQFDYIYIRDFLDAITSFIFYDFDDCIRRIMTSFDNALLHYNVKKELRKILKLDGNQRLTPEVVFDNVVRREELNFNIKKVYETRNRIVHDRLRLTIKNELFTRKAVGTMFYILKGSMVESPILANYILQIELQYMSLLQICRGLDMDRFITAEPQPLEERQILNSAKEIDDSLFGSLKMRKEELP